MARPPTTDMTPESKAVKALSELVAFFAGYHAAASFVLHPDRTPEEAARLFENEPVVQRALAVLASLSAEAESKDDEEPTDA